MPPVGVTIVSVLRVRRDRAGVANYLAKGDVKPEVAALLRRWTQPNRPAFLFVVDWGPPFAAVYAEDELFESFPAATLTSAEPIDGIVRIGC
jgi:hypothetical protein